MNNSNQKNKRHRILYTQKPTGGGSTIALYELVKGLDTNKYEPIVLFLQKNKYFDKFNDLRIKTLILDISESEKKRQHRIESVIGKIYLFIIDILLAIRLAAILKKEKIDLVHQNLGFDKFVMFASRITKTPEVCHFRHFVKTQSRIGIWLASSCAAMLYTTQAIADSYINLKIVADKYSIVYEPIDIQRFSELQDSTAIKQELNINDKEYMVSNIGRITPWKGQYYFLQAMENIVTQYPNIKILIVGEPGENSIDKKYFNLLKEIAKKPSLNKHVIFTGKRDDIAEIMKASDIVVHSASEPEPFGLVVAESMAAGTPVIATQGGGVVEIINDGITGLLVPMKNVIDMKEAVQKLLESQVLRKTISINALKDVAERFSIRRHVTKVQKIYEEILESHI